MPSRIVKASACHQKLTSSFRLTIPQFRDVRLYFPHNIDFRGRAYPIPPHLNHLGSDVCRGMLMFDRPRMLGERGLYWLKIQLANVAGQDKYACVHVVGRVVELGGLLGCICSRRGSYV